MLTAVPGLVHGGLNPAAFLLRDLLKKTASGGGKPTGCRFARMNYFFGFWKVIGISMMMVAPPSFLLMISMSPP